jgi:DNA cross-link repair 1B protein
MSVTLLDARNHCPGAVMFLFQGYFGNILYTGDFRFSPEMADITSAVLRKVFAGNDISVDVLYLDTTFCHPKYQFCDTRAAVEQVARFADAHPHCDVLVAGDHLGKVRGCYFDPPVNLVSGLIILIPNVPISSLRLVAPTLTAFGALP